MFKKISTLFSVTIFLNLTLGELAYFLGWFIIINLLWSHMFYFDGVTYWSGYPTIWGDWMAHISYILNFAYRPFPLPFHPQFWGQPFRYHFAADMISGLLMKSGLSLVQSTVLPSLVCMTSLIVMLYVFFLRVFKSKAVAILSSCLFLFNGGFGVFSFLYTYILHRASLPPYPTIYMLTKNDALGFRWMNFFLAEFIPERAFLLGLPISLWLLTLLWRIFDSGIRSISKPMLVIAGIASGLLPVIHYQSFYVILLTGIYVCFMSLLPHRDSWHKWVWFFTPVLVFSGAIIFWVFGGIPKGTIKFQTGSIGPPQLLSLIWFWFINTGIMFILIPIACIKADKKHRLFYLPFLFLFIISNIVTFQQDPWDNRKFLLYWYLVSSGLVGQLLYTALRTKRYLVGLIVFYLAIVSGFVDVVNVFQFNKQKQPMFSILDMNFAQIVRSKTQFNDVFLTAPITTYFGITSGRQIVMGCEYCLQDYGYNTTTTKRDIDDIYLGRSDARTLIRKYSIDYIVIGTRERRSYAIDDAFFQTLGPVLVQDNNTIIYDVHKIKQDNG